MVGLLSDAQPARRSPRDLGIAPEPKGPDGDYAAFGGFAYMVSSQVPPAKQNAGCLFIQWLTSKEMAKPLIRAWRRGGAGERGQGSAVQAKFPNLAPMVKTWETATVPDWRPQLQCYPRFSDIVSDWGSRIELKQIAVKEGLDGMAKSLTDYMNSSNCWAHTNNPEQYMNMKMN